MVDWLENDPSQPFRRTRAEAHVNSHPVLAFCRDICNGSRHAQLQTKGVETTIQTTVSTFSIEGKSGESQQEVVKMPELLVRLPGADFIGVSDFAHQCIEAWNVLLWGEGLL